MSSLSSSLNQAVAIRPLKVERVSFFTVTLCHLEGVCRCVLGVGILGRGDEVVTVARASHCDCRNRDRCGKEVEKGTKETARGVLTQCVVWPRVAPSRYEEEAGPRDLGHSSAYDRTTRKKVGEDVLKYCAWCDERGRGAL